MISIAIAILNWNGEELLRRFLKVLEDNSLNKIQIQIGNRDKGFIEVISGLNKDDLIVAEGLKKVNPKGKIKPIKK